MDYKLSSTEYLYLCGSLGITPNERVFPISNPSSRRVFTVPTSSLYNKMIEHLVVNEVVTLDVGMANKSVVTITDKGIDAFKKAHHRFTNGMTEISNDDTKELSIVKVKGHTLIGHAMAYLLGTETQFALTDIKGVGRKQTAILTLEAPPDSDFTATFIDSFGAK